MKRILKWMLAGAGCGAAALWVANTSLFTSTEAHQTRLIAHRGVHQIYVGTDRSSDACHAAPVAPITHGFIENTRASMQEAFRLGADVVELDVHLTPDDVFAVFHDWTLECRTNGKGVTHKQDFATLATLDVAYNIDEGTGQFPLRGTGVGLMPSLTQLLDTEMGGQFLVNFKSRRAQDGTALAQMLSDPAYRDQIFGVYGGAPPTRTAMDQTPGLRGFDRASIKDCLLNYALRGWSGHVPDSCHNTMVFVPQNYAAFLWGWPHRFTQRLKAVGTDVILVGPYDGSGFTSGIDDTTQARRVPTGFDGYVWTNRIEHIGPLLRAMD